MAVISKKKIVVKKTSEETETPVSETTLDEETLEDVLLDQEALDVDIDEPHPKKEATTQTTDTKKPIKPRGDFSVHWGERDNNRPDSPAPPIRCELCEYVIRGGQRMAGTY